MTAPVTDPRAPQLPGELQAHAPGALDDDLSWAEAVVTGDFTGQDAEDLDVRECRLAGVRLTGADLTRLRMANTVVDGADLSGTTLYDAVLERVELRGCRMSGVVLAGATFRDVTLVECKLDDANFRLGKGERVRFERCVLRGADFYGAVFSDAALQECDLTEVQFSQVDFRGARLHGSVLDGIRGAEYLKGVVVDSSQIVPLALPLFVGLGITVDEGD